MRFTSPPSWSSITSNGSRSRDGRGIACSRATSRLPAARLGRFPAKRITPASRPERIICLTAPGASLPGKPATSRCPASWDSGSWETSEGDVLAPSPSVAPKANASAASAPAIAVAIRRRLVLATATS